MSGDQDKPDLTDTVVHAAEAAGEVAQTAVKKLGWGGVALIVSAIAAAVLIVMAGGLRYAPITPQGRMFLEARASGLKLGRIGVLHIEGLSGDIWKDFGVRRLTISDEKGVWLEAHDLRVAWRPTELFGRRFHAEQVAARDVSVLRRPIMGPAGKPGEAPLSVELDAFAFRLITRPEFSGQAGDFDVSGAYDMARLGGQKGQLAASSRLHKGDHLTLDFDLGRGDALHLKADAEEANGGAIAGALGLPANRAFDLKAKADGKINRAAFNIVARSGATTPLQADGAWTPEGGSARGRLDLDASSLTQRLEHMFGPQANFTIDGKKATADGLSALNLQVRAENLTLDAHGLADLAKRRTGPEGLAFAARIGALKRIVSIPQMGQGLADGVFRLEDGGFSVEGDADVADLELLGYHLKRAKGPAKVRWARGELEIKAQATTAGGGGTGLLALLGASPKAAFEGARVKGGRFLIKAARIDAPNLIVTGKGEHGVLGGLTFDGEMRVASMGPVRAGAKGSVVAKWTASSFAGRPWGFSVDSRAASFATGYAEIDRLLGATPRLSGKASWNDGVLTVSDARLDGANASVSSSGKLTAQGLGLDFKLDWSAAGPFVAGPVEIAGKAVGDGKVGGTLSAPKAELNADFDSIDLPQLPLKKAHLTLDFAHGPNATDGAATLQATSDYGPARGRTAFRFSPGGIELSGLDIDAGGARAQGAVSLRDGMPATADLTVAVGPGAFLPQGQVKGSARLVDTPGGGGPSATLDLTAQDVAAGDWKLRLARIKADGPLARLPLSIDARGEAPGGFWKLGGTGELAQGPGGKVYDLILNASGKMGRTEIKTREAAKIRFGDGPTQARLRLAIDKGRADIDADLGGSIAMLKAELAGVTLTAFDPDLDGDIDGAFNLRGQGDVLGGDFTMRLSNARERGAKVDQSLNAKIHGELNDRLLTIVADGDNRQGLKAEANLVLPVEASAKPLVLMIDKKRGVQGRFMAQGEIKPLWDLLLGPERSLSGRINLQASLGGTLADPRLIGSATLDSGGFEDGQSGLRLRNVTLRAALADNAIDVSQAIGEDGQGGAVSGSGRISLARDGIGNFKLDMRSFRLIDNDLASAVATGQASVNRSADGKIKLTGAVTLDRADVSAQTKTPVGVVAMDVIERNRPPDLDQGLQRRPSTGGMILDLDLKAPRRVFVRGRGLDVELSLDAHVGGTSLAPTLSGVSRMVRGEYDFAGKRFEFNDDGVVYLSTQLDHIRLNLSATREATALTAVVKIQGTAAKPEITLTSKPELPSDEVLSQVLFGASAAQLTPIEAAQLASALAALAGGGGFDVIGNLRSFARLDRLAFAESATGMTVAGGKYVTDDVYVEIIGGGREGPAAQVEWRVRRTLSLVSRIGSQNDAKLSVRWRKDY